MFLMRRLLTPLIVLALISTNAAYAQNIDIGPASVEPIELSQAKKELRVVALANGAAEVVAALGFRATLIGRDIASTTPELKGIPIVTSGHQVIAEKIVSLKPDLVIVDASVGPASAVKVIQAAKIKIVKIDEAWNLTDIYRKVSQIGISLGEPTRATKLVKEMKASIAQAQIHLGWKPRIVFLYLRGPSSIYLMGGSGSGADSLINSLGGIDVGAQISKRPFSTLTSESLVQANPDVILVMSKGLKSVGDIQGLLNLPGVAQTKAGKNKKVLSVDDSLLLSFGPRTPALLSKMADALKALK